MISYSLFVLLLLLLLLPFISPFSLLSAIRFETESGDVLRIGYNTVIDLESSKRVSTSQSIV